MWQRLLIFLLPTRFDLGAYCCFVIEKFLTWGDHVTVDMGLSVKTVCWDTYGCDYAREGWRAVCGRCVDDESGGIGMAESSRRSIASQTGKCNQLQPLICYVNKR